MQLARTHYGVQQNRYAIYYYGKVERGEPQWLEALFEPSWANYRIGQYEQALGNLITLSSPFFRDEYFPEALILKAVIYYENCRYRESHVILEDFERIYLPGARRAGAAREEEHGRQRVLQRARRRAEEEQGGPGARRDRPASSSAS